MKSKSKLKTSIIGLFFVASMFTIFTSCKKYSDGKLINLRSRSERVSNTWQVENYKINGNDYTSLVSSYEETFTKTNNYSYSWGNLNGSGKWNFQNKDTEIQLDGNDDQSSRKLFITKLEEKEFWYHYFEGNDKHEVHLISK